MPFIQGLAANELYITYKCLLICTACLASLMQAVCLYSHIASIAWRPTIISGRVLFWNRCLFKFKINDVGYSNTHTQS